MTRAATKERRRESLIRATIAAINLHGYADSTIARIGAEAGFTGANIYRHFANKAALFEATMRYLMQQVRDEERKHLADAACPVDRARAVVAARFSERVFNKQNCTLWVHLWANAHTSPELGQIQRVHHRLLRRSLRRELASTASAQPVSEAVALELVMMIDGLWLEYAQDSMSMDANSACQLALAALDTRLLNQ